MPYALLAAKMKCKNNKCNQNVATGPGHSKKQKYCPICTRAYEIGYQKGHTKTNYYKGYYSGYKNCERKYKIYNIPMKKTIKK